MYKRLYTFRAIQFLIGKADCISRMTLSRLISARDLREILRARNQLSLLSPRGRATSGMSGSPTYVHVFVLRVVSPLCIRVVFVRTKHSLAHTVIRNAELMTTTIVNVSKRNSNGNL